MRGAALVLLAPLAIVASACSWPRHPSAALDALDALPQPVPTTTAAPSSEQSAAEQECNRRDWKTASLRPDAAAMAGPAVSALREKGRIRVGVDVTTLGFASRDPETGEPVGFEVDLARDIGRHILGPDAGDDAVVLVPVVTDTKLSRVADGTIDMSISANSMSCARWDDVDFSSEYYTAHQAFLVRTDRPLADLAAVAGARVCVTAGSSSKGILEEAVPGIEPIVVATRPECLVAIQEGEADAYFGHDSFLYGLQSQDPTTEIQFGLLPDDVTESHYGIAISKDKPDLVRAVNAALEEIRIDGTWDDLHAGLETTLQIPPAPPPTARYRD